MAVIMMIGKYPPNKVKDLLKVYTSKEKPKNPDFLKKVKNWVTPGYDGLYKNYAVYECPDDKLVESMKALVKRYNLYANIEGYHYCMEHLVDADEAIKLMQ
jgi:hypothetical protein